MEVDKNKIKSDGLRIGAYANNRLGAVELEIDEKDDQSLEKESGLSDIDIGGLMMIENLIEMLLNYRKEIVGNKLDDYSDKSGADLMSGNEDG